MEILKNSYLSRSPYARRAMTLILATVAVLLIVAIAAVAVDGGLLYLTRNSCQVTAEAAALAAVRHLPDTTDAVDAAVAYAGKNMPISANGTVLANSDAVPGHWVGATRTFLPGGQPLNAMKITVRRAQQNSNPISLAFARGFGPGFEQADVLASAVAIAAQDWDVMIVQDVDFLIGDFIGSVRTMHKTIIDCLKDNTDGTSLAGIVVFSGTSRLHKDFTPVASGYASLVSAINSVNVCGSAGMPPCNTGRNHGKGLERATNAFIATPQTFNALGRAIVLISAGQPYHMPGGAGGGPFGNTDEGLRAFAIEEADRANAAGISIFVVSFNPEHVLENTIFLSSLVRGAGIFLESADETELADAMLQICASLPPRLVD